MKFTDTLIDQINGGDDVQIRVPRPGYISEHLFEGQVVSISDGKTRMVLALDGDPQKILTVPIPAGTTFKVKTESALDEYLRQPLGSIFELARPENGRRKRRIKLSNTQYWAVEENRVFTINNTGSGWPTKQPISHYVWGLTP